MSGIKFRAEKKKKKKKKITGAMHALSDEIVDK